MTVNELLTALLCGCYKGWWSGEDVVVTAFHDLEDHVVHCISVNDISGGTTPMGDGCVFFDIYPREEDE